MYEEFFGLKENPFSLLPDPDFLYLTEKHRTALRYLEYCLTNRAGFTVITGEIGSGKTTLIRKLLQRSDPTITIGLVNNTQCSGGEELLRWIAFALALDYSGKHHVELYQTFTEFLATEYGAGRRVVVIIDEAQQLGPELLEQVRLLSNVNAYKHQFVQFLLVGQPNLHEYLRRPELHQLAQRIVVDYHLSALNLVETVGYVRHRLKIVNGDPDLFSIEALKLIWRFSRGIPRLINSLCDKALVYGYAEDAKRIDRQLVVEVLNDQQSSLAPVLGRDYSGSARVGGASDHRSSIETLYRKK